jgi:hypothetical protein
VRNHRRRAGGEEDNLDELTPFGPTYRDTLLDPAVRQAIRLNKRLEIQELLGPSWRDERTNVRTAAKFLGVEKTYVWKNLRGRNGVVQIGKVWDHHRKLSMMATVSDYDNLAAWSLFHRWPLNAERRSALRFFRTASAARIAGLDLGTAEVTTKALEKWGLNLATTWRWANVKGAYYQFWAGRTRKVRVARRGERGGNTLRVWRVADLLDWFLLITEPGPALASDREKVNQDPSRNCFRSIAMNLDRYHRSPTTWDGACNLQRAWSWFWLLMDVDVGWRPGEINVSARRLDNYISRSLQGLATADPDWHLPPVDISGIHPDRYYPVWIPPGEGARTDVVHVPFAVRLIQVLGDGYSKSGEAHHAARKFGLDTGRIAAVKGSSIIARPFAYTR